MDLLKVKVLERSVEGEEEELVAHINLDAITVIYEIETSSGPGLQIHFQGGGRIRALATIEELKTRQMVTEAARVMRAVAHG